MFNQYTIEITKHNLITLLGESFLMNRLINDRLQPIQYIALGKGTARPQKKDTRLGKQTIRKTCNLTNKQLILSCDFEAKEILDTTEIGVITNDDILITHDLYETITSTILGNSTSSIHLEYNIIFTTGGIRSQWKTSTTQNNILYTYEPNKVVNVIEYNTNSGYVKVNSLNDLKTTKGAYYYDIASKNLYIRTTRSNTLNNISDMEIIVQTK